jgi:hypothetical protein
VLAPSLQHHARNLLVLGAVLVALVSALEWDRTRAAEHYWGRDLADWVRDLDAPHANRRDSAVVAVSVLAAGAWRRLDETRDSAAAPRLAVLRAVSALGRRLGDPDTLIREHAVTALLDVAVGGVETEGQLRDPTTDSARMGALRDVARRAAGVVLQAVVRVGGPDARALSPLEVLAALDVSPDLVPTIDALALRAPTPMVRALATAVALRPAPVPDDGRRRAELARAALADSSPDVRLAAADAFARDPDGSELLRSDAPLRLRVCTALDDPVSAVRDAVRLLVIGMKLNEPLQCGA